MTLDEGGVVATGVALFALSWTPWYAIDVLGVSVPYNAWELGLTGLLPVLLSLYAALRVLWLRWRPLSPEVPLSPAAEPFGAAAFALVVLLYRAIDAPGVGAEQTLWLLFALSAVLLQVLFAGRNVARTGFRA